MVCLLFAFSSGYAETNVNQEVVEAQSKTQQNTKVLGFVLMGAGTVLFLVGLSSANGESEYNPSTGMEEKKINSSAVLPVGAGLVATMVGFFMVTNVNE